MDDQIAVEVVAEQHVAVELGSNGVHGNDYLRVEGQGPLNTAVLGSGLGGGAVAEAAEAEPLRQPEPSGQDAAPAPAMGDAVTAGGVPDSSAPRAKRTAALKAGAIVSGWKEAEAAPFTDIAGKDIFVTAKTKADRARQREAGRERRLGSAPASSATPPASAAASPRRPRGRPPHSGAQAAAQQARRPNQRERRPLSEDDDEEEEDDEAAASAMLDSDDPDFGALPRYSSGKRAAAARAIGGSAAKRLRPARAAPAPAPPPAPARSAPAPPPQPAAAADDLLYGCPKCRYLKGGCGTCRSRPTYSRPRMRWRPEAGRPQPDALPAPSFRPTPEEFKDPIAYIAKIMPEAEKYGLAHIIPPEGWEPPFALERGTNGLGMESFRFQIRKQLTSQLCCRKAPERGAGEAAPGMAAGEGRYGGRKLSQQAQRFDAAADAAAADHQQQQQQQRAATAGGQLTAADIMGALAAANGGDPEAAAAAAAAVDATLAPAAAVGPPRSPPVAAAQQAPAEEQQDEEPPLAEFGFVSLDKKHTLRSFAAYADWVKATHFSEPVPKEPSVEEVEAEFWRIVEAPDAALESLYGQDLDSGHHGSGFPLPQWRRRLLEAHLASKQRPTPAGTPPAVTLPPYATAAEAEYAAHAWNINNMPRCRDSVLRYLLGDRLITGVMVPWLYVGSCLSAFCWHVEDHALYSVNYHHMGAPKVWYGVPHAATQALEDAMRDALPHLFEASPNLLYQLVTTMSPSELKRRGVPVYRIVHEAGSFVVTMPNAYHAGFNTGFNCAEAVNFAAPAWLPYGTDVAAKYRATHKPVTMSHDSLLVALVTAAAHVSPSPPAAADAADGSTPGAAEGAAAAAAGTAAGAGGSETAPAADSTAAKGAAVAAGAAASGFGPLGDIPWQDAPLEGIRLATGELALRLDEERQRWAAGLAALGLDAIPQRPIDAAAPAGGRDEGGVHVNTDDCDCAECSGDLWLAAVVSPAAPGVAVCLEHAAVLVEKHGCAADSLVALYRHTPDQLAALVDAAVGRIPGAADAVEAARQRRGRAAAERVHALPVGPLYNPDEDDDDAEEGEEEELDGGAKEGRKKMRGRPRGNGWSKREGKPAGTGRRRGRPSNAEKAARLEAARLEAAATAAKASLNAASALVAPHVELKAEPATEGGAAGDAVQMDEDGPAAARAPPAPEHASPPPQAAPCSIAKTSGGQQLAAEQQPAQQPAAPAGAAGQHAAVGDVAADQLDSLPLSQSLVLPPARPSQSLQLENHSLDLNLAALANGPASQAGAGGWPNFAFGSFPGSPTLLPPDDVAQPSQEDPPELAEVRPWFAHSLGTTDAGTSLAGSALDGTNAAAIAAAAAVQSVAGGNVPELQGAQPMLQQQSQGSGELDPSRQPSFVSSLLM